MEYFLDVEFQFLLLCLSTLLTLINPLGIAPIFIVMTERFSKDEKIQIAKKGIATGTITLLIFTFLGSIIKNLTSSGLARSKIDKIMLLMQTLFPDPVAPAMRR